MCMRAASRFGRYRTISPLRTVRSGTSRRWALCWSRRAFSCSRRSSCWWLALIFVPLGQALADEFRESRRRILDYSINVGASLVGIALFALLSSLSAPPWTWVAGAAVFLLSLVSWRDWVETLSVAVSMAFATLLVASYDPPSAGQV